MNDNGRIAPFRSVDAFAGLTGTIKCDGIGECDAGGVQIFQVTDGAFVQVSGLGME